MSVLEEVLEDCAKICKEVTDSDIDDTIKEAATDLICEVRDIVSKLDKIVGRAEGIEVRGRALEAASPKLKEIFQKYSLTREVIDV